MRPLYERRNARPPLELPALIAWSAARFRAESLEELLRADPTIAVVHDPAGAGPELADACILRGGSLAPMAKALRASAIFTRHLQPVDTLLPVRFLEDVIVALREARQQLPPAARVDLCGLSRAHTRLVLRETAPETGAGALAPEVALSALVADGWLHLGTSPVADCLSAWPGGDPQRPHEPVSRAAAKCREALEYLHPPLPAGAQVLDLGAAPGGFTSVLLERGARVLAIDPAPLAPALTDAPGLTFIRGYADSLDPCDVQPLDLLTCDVVTSPTGTAILVRPFAGCLKPGAPAIVTLKLRAKSSATAQLEGAAALFAPELELIRLRHLFANYCEVTAFLRRPAPRPA